MPYRSDKSIADLFDIGPMRRAKRAIVQRTGEYVRDRAAYHSPVAKLPEGLSTHEYIDSRGGRVPGTLKKSWRVGEVQIDLAGDIMTVEVYSLDPIAELVEFPTQPHLIVPRNAGGVLAFPMNGRTVFATIVHHPGTKGAFMLTTALAEGEAEIERIAREEFEKWARGDYG